MSETGVTHGWRPGRRTTIAGAVVLALAAIVVPFALRGVGGSGAQASPAARVSPPRVAPAGHEHPVTDPVLGPRGDLPELLPARSALADGARVRLGDVTDGVLRRAPGGAWQVLVRWNGELQPLPMRGPVSLAGAAVTSWVAPDGLLYTRLQTGTDGRFQVYAWAPRGGSTAYTPPALVSVPVGQVCFNRAFTAFGDCRSTG
jgi:hypothetical protein